MSNSSIPPGNGNDGQSKAAGQAQPKAAGPGQSKGLSPSQSKMPAQAQPKATGQGQSKGLSQSQSKMPAQARAKGLSQSQPKMAGVPPKTSAPTQSKALLDSDKFQKVGEQIGAKLVAVDLSVFHKYIDKIVNVKLPPIIRELRSVLASPNAFFDDLDVNAGFKYAILFNLSVCLINGLGTAGEKQWSVTALVDGFMFTVLLGLVLTAYFKLSSRLVGGEASFRQIFIAVSYALAPMAFAWVPLVQIIAYGYFFFLLRKALLKVYDISEGRAILVLALCVFVFIGYSQYLTLISFKKLFGAPDESKYIDAPLAPKHPNLD